MSKITDEISRVIGPALKEAGLELVEVEYQRAPEGWVLRIYLDKEGGINLTDCEEWSQKIGSILDSGDFLRNPYSLEVSSPGLERPIKKEDDFRRFAGERAVIRTYTPIDGQKNFKGIILSAGDGKVSFNDISGRNVTIALEMISRARLDPDIKI